MTPRYHTMLVASGRSPQDVLDEVMVHRYQGSGEYIYRPHTSVVGRASHGPENFTPANQEWLQNWHSENPDYSLRSALYRRGKYTDPNGFGTRSAIAMPSVDEVAKNHHEINADVVHVPSHTKVGDFHFSLASWPELPSGRSIGTAHIWSFYRHNEPEQKDQHSGVMTNVLHSWLNHAKDQGIRHGFIQGDASKGYWMHNITKHPEMVWGGVEYDADEGRTRRAGEMDSRRISVIKKHPMLFTGWPGTRKVQPTTESDAFILKWNNEKPQPVSGFGPIPNTMMRIEHGKPQTYPGSLDRACWHNATRNAKRKNSKLKLVVGFAVRRDEVDKYERGEGQAPLMYSHAFNLTEKGEIHDPTWGSDGIKHFRYYGHVVPDHQVQRFKNGSDTANWFGHHFQNGHDRGPNSFNTGITKPNIQHTKDASHAD